VSEHRYLPIQLP
jgi:hypothetical protein